VWERIGRREKEGWMGKENKFGEGRRKNNRSRV
jgi:hypothetical protein